MKKNVNSSKETASVIGQMTHTGSTCSRNVESALRETEVTGVNKAELKASEGKAKIAVT